jgi:formate hydrogenlyase subunit 6/NADH:ubiquinone oxidoreductase subunit I
MTYVIAGSCIKDDACIEACPVDCIHPTPEKFAYALELNAEFFAERSTAERTTT